MEELKQGEKSIIYNADERLRKLLDTNQVGGIIVEVKEDWHNKMVVLTADGRDTLLTIQGARDLALALRQSANKLNPRKAKHD